MVMTVSGAAANWEVVLGSAVATVSSGEIFLPNFVQIRVSLFCSTDKLVEGSKSNHGVRSGVRRRHQMQELYQTLSSRRSLHSFLFSNFIKMQENRDHIFSKFDLYIHRLLLTICKIAPAPCPF
ncbi:hypothetical protein Droror1_Dr00022619 [Drosera rotundifolia]